MRVGIYAGSFDPFHIGHENIAIRGTKFFDELIIAIGVHPTKSTLYELQDRKVMIERTFEKYPNVTVESYDGLLVNYLEELEALDDEDHFFLLRGLRDEADFQGESKLAYANRAISTTRNETLFILTDPALGHVSSTLIRELAHTARGAPHPDEAPGHAIGPKPP